MATKTCNIYEPSKEGRGEEEKEGEEWEIEEVKEEKVDNYSKTSLKV